jgi:hypothetical protein
MSEVSESTVRKYAKRRGYGVSKSRDRTQHMDNFGEYMLVNLNNCVVLGGKFDASLNEIMAYLKGEPLFSEMYPNAGTRL